ncbi:acyclic terpene utilization AtuA family protein [Bacillus sp. B15-48]|uniref:acyclic terpene utilization AtuA family protein n=1 Tax=Bacillus sp. B15-48 TaxID=1548601 RepID=UPI00193FFE62|nr:acyclic terpene utilization AtuA family protein [Bacillus sp. B15-48]MBM4763672.1 acyclic terpene utilization AtuA family protein [Bacillus sp. B15-48]
MKKQSIVIGCGSGYAEDNLEPAIELAKKANLDYLCFDSLAERTLSMAQMRKLNDPNTGYDVRLEQIARIFLPYVDKGLKIIGNMGAANPEAAIKKVQEIAEELGLKNIRLAAITGDDVLEQIKETDPVIYETGKPLSELPGNIVSANAYIGADAIVEALEKGANFVIGGRLADPSLYLAPMIYEFGWEEEDWERKGKGIILGHILECGTHVTGGNYADPPYRVVPGLDRLGLPYATVEENGDGVVSILDDAGGLMTVDTVKSQLVYEVHNPRNYITPDGVADLKNVTVKQVGEKDVLIENGRGKPRPEKFKVLVGVLEGYIGEGEMSYAGPGAYERALLSEETLKKRFDRYYKDHSQEIRYDLIGVNSIHGSASPMPSEPPYEVRLRSAMRTESKEVAEAWAHEVELLYLLGGAGAGGNRRNVRQVLAMYSTFLDYKDIHLKVSMIEEVLQ